MIPAGELRRGDTISVFDLIGMLIRSVEDVPGSPDEVLLRFRNESESVRLRRKTLVRMLKRTKP